ncbi:MAG TPA: PA14 domain-containing protein, partial [Chitinophagaceae bacterium]|nr:PA14 domain-containing protein [Chitinophagaceae bacterium]
MVRFLALAVASLCCHLAIAQNVFSPLDPLITYDSTAPAGSSANPLQPAPNVMAKWVRTPRLAWNTSNFKSYIWNGMAFRLRFPNNYNPANASKYPVLLFFHGGGEVGNIHDDEFHLLLGAQLFEERINNNEWNGFLLFPQETVVGWDDSYFTRINSVIDSLQKYNRADGDRVVAMGLSAGGFGAVAYANTYPRRVAAALPASPAQIRSLTDAIPNFKQIPVWMGNGGLDNNPDPFNAQVFYNAMRNSGGNIYQSFYANKGHDTWLDMWNQHNATGGYILSSYLNTAHKAQPVLYFQNQVFCADAPIVAKMGISPGFAAYEWDLNGSSIAGANGNEYTATQVGQYRVRFKRELTGEWSSWTPNPVVIATKPCSPDTVFTEHFTADNFFVSATSYNISNFSCLGGIMTSGTDMITQDATGQQGGRFLVNYTYPAGGGCNFALNEQVWKTYTPVTVTPNTNYTYTFYLANQNGLNPAKLAPVINGTVLIADSVQCEGAGTASWTKYSFPWNSGAASTADLGIINRSAETNGNEFAIDAISLSRSSTTPALACATNTSPADGTTLNSTTALLSWSTVANATAYDVYLWTGATPPASPTTSVTANSYTATALTAGTTYKWYVAPRNANTVANCAATNSSSFTTAPLPVPACAINSAPLNGATVPGLNSAVLSWTAAATATSYDIYLWSGNSAPTAAIASSTVTSYTANNLLPGTKYNWYVLPRNALGSATGCASTAASSFFTSAAAGAPPSCVATVSPANGTSIASNGSVTLEWSAAANASSYDVYFFAKGNQPTAPVANVSSTSYSVTGLLPGKDYTWFVTPRNGNGAAANCSINNSSSFSTIVLSLPSCVKTSSPVNGSLLLTRNAAPLRWEASPTATAYDVYLWSGPTPPAQPFATVSTTSYTAFGLQPATNYQWYIVPKNSVGAAVGCEGGNYSAFRTGGIVSLPVSCAVNIAPAEGSTVDIQPKITLSWSAARNATAYDVFIWTGALQPSTPVARVNGLSYEADGLLPGTTYKWFVAPANLLAGALTCGLHPSSFITTNPPVVTGGQGLRGDYFNNPNVSGQIALTRTDATINFDWGNDAPAARIDKKSFSVRWTGQVLAPVTQLYTFYTLCDNGARLWVNGQLLVDSWKDKDAREEHGSIWLEAGVKYNIRLEYFEKKGKAMAKLFWSGAATPKAIVPQRYLYLP